MSSREAATILGLDEGKTYSARDLEDAITQAEVRALAILRHPPHGDLEQREQARQELPLIREAGAVLLPLIKNGKLRITSQGPAQSMSSPVTSVKGVAQQSVYSRAGSFSSPSPTKRASSTSLSSAYSAGLPSASPAGPSSAPASARPSSSSATAPSGWMMLKTAIRAILSLLLVVWWLLTWPIRLLIQRKLVRGAISFIFVALLVWLSWSFFTGGGQALAGHVQRVCEALNKVLGRAIK